MKAVDWDDKEQKTVPPVTTQEFDRMVAMIASYDHDAECNCVKSGDLTMQCAAS